MSKRVGQIVPDLEPRHSSAWYREQVGAEQVATGERIFIQCDGGPCTSRLERFPPRLEIAERDGSYVLHDDGPLLEWRYIFLPN